MKSINNQPTMPNLTINTVYLDSDLNSELSDLKRESVQCLRYSEEALATVQDNPAKRFIICHHLDIERFYLEKAFAGRKYLSVNEHQSKDEQERHLIDFSEGKYDILITIPCMAAASRNFQQACYDIIFVGIRNTNFDEFIGVMSCIRPDDNVQDRKAWILQHEEDLQPTKDLLMKWASKIEGEG